jgi:hypothetical protein
MTPGTIHGNRRSPLQHRFSNNFGAVNLSSTTLPPCALNLDRDYYFELFFREEERENESITRQESAAGNPVSV